MPKNMGNQRKALIEYTKVLVINRVRAKGLWLLLRRTRISVFNRSVIERRLRALIGRGLSWRSLRLRHGYRCIIAAA